MPLYATQTSNPWILLHGFLLYVQLYVQFESLIINGYTDEIYYTIHLICRDGEPSHILVKETKNHIVIVLFRYSEKRLKVAKLYADDTFS